MNLTKKEQDNYKNKRRIFLLISKDIRKMVNQIN